MCAAVWLTAELRAASVWVEAEAFENKGGWVVDQQFMDQMGSAFLLAHGLGVPVSDASTTVELPEAGVYRVLARTRNWAAHWTRAEAPGQFSVTLGGQSLANRVGVGGPEWAWQEAGTLALEKGRVKLALRDLSGFDGRCDAVLLTSDVGFVPPDGLPALERYRREAGAVTAPKRSETFDLVVVGGGVPGVCASITAARLGLKVALVQDRPVLGGNNSSEVRVPLGGRINLAPYPKLGDVVKEIGPAKGAYVGPAALYEDERKLNAVRAEPNLSLLLSTRAVAVEKEGSRIAALIVRHVERGEERRLVAPLVLDSTGDGAVGFLAGAEYRLGRESRDETNEKSAPEAPDAMTMGSSVQWCAREEPDASLFPDIAWGLPLDERSAERVFKGGWQWENGMNRHPVDEFERIRDYGLLAVYSNWSFLKNRAADKARFATWRLEWAAYVAGKRESRRLLGDVVVNGRDLVERRLYPDATACTTWSVDLHYPEAANAARFPDDPFKSVATHHAVIHPYPLPYRCLYSKNVANLFMAGRNISVTHVALGSARVMRTGGMMGEVVGMAASLCKKHGCLPRDVYAAHLDELKALMTQGVGLGKEQPEQNYTLGRTLPDSGSGKKRK